MLDFVLFFLHVIVTQVRLASPATPVARASPIYLKMPAPFCRGRIRTGATSPVDPESQPQARTQPLPGDCMISGLCILFMRRARVLGSAIGLKPSTLLNLHTLLTRRKYRPLFSPQRSVPRS
jgi:hypothetical protein